MPKAEGSIVINRPLEQVFMFVAKGENNAQWRPSVMDCKLSSGRANTVGAVYEQGMQGPGGRRIPADYEITKLEPHKLIGFKVIAGPARPEGLYTFEQVQGGTKIHFSLSWQPKGLAIFLAPMVGRQMPKEIETLSNLKAVLEK